MALMPSLLMVCHSTSQGHVKGGTWISLLPIGVWVDKGVNMTAYLRAAAAMRSLYKSPPCPGNTAGTAGSQPQQAASS
eukprot:1136131-Pelagomonas_calceolata.AAC.1